MNPSSIHGNHRKNRQKHCRRDAPPQNCHHVCNFRNRPCLRPSLAKFKNHFIPNGYKIGTLFALISNFGFQKEGFHPFLTHRSFTTSIFFNDCVSSGHGHPSGLRSPPPVCSIRRQPAAAFLFSDTLQSLTKDPFGLRVSVMAQGSDALPGMSVLDRLLNAPGKVQPSREKGGDAGKQLARDMFDSLFRSATQQPIKREEHQ